MIGALIIVFREVLEAGLIVGILLAATRTIPGSRRWIAAGLVAGLLGSAVVAALTGAIADSFEGYGQEILNATILGVAVVMLAWHNLWMATHGRSLAAELKSAGHDVAEGHRPFFALAVIVGLAVLREGSEVVLFLYGIAASGGLTAAGLFAGGMLGLLLGGAVSALTYGGLLRVPVRYFFTVTNWLITLLAAGMAAQAVGFLEQADVVSVLGQTLWDTSAWLSEKSLLGRVLHTMFGYMDQPTVLQGLSYVAVLILIFGASKLMQRQAPAAVR
jgi:high-affinity iron transporter